MADTDLVEPDAAQTADSADVVLRVGLAQIDTSVGDLAANAALVIDYARRGAAAGADLVAFPELTITGYPPEDLVLRASFRAASRDSLTLLAGRLRDEDLGETAVVVGYVDDDAGPRNAAAFIHRGAVVARYFKHHLPNYGVFDERRTFVPGSHFVVVRHRGVDVALTICEDVWQDGGPFAVARQVGVGLIVNINGSPYERNKDDVRLPLVQRRAVEADAPIVYVNTVGGQDELVFDGDSLAVGRDGDLLARAPQFTEDLYLVELSARAAPTSASLAGGGPAASPVQVCAGMSVERYESLDAARHDTARHPPGAASGGASQASDAAARPPAPAPALCGIAASLPDEAEVWGALVLGLRDYVVKNGFVSVVLGVSGGIDSAVVAALAADAIGGDRVHGIALPSAYSSEHSLADAEQLCLAIGARYRVVPIAPMVDAFVGALGLTGLAEENVQARVRGTTLMALSNAEGHLVLATGNKSELAVGYSTIYGDAVGGFAPIKDVPKTLVWELARWRNADASARGQLPPVPENSIDKPPSAELRPGQLDSDSLPDYEVLDAVLGRSVGLDMGVEAIVADGFERELTCRIARMVDHAEWKRRQYPPGTKITHKNFGKDRRVPITSRWKE